MPVLIVGRDGATATAAGQGIGPGDMSPGGDGQSGGYFGGGGGSRNGGSAAGGGGGSSFAVSGATGVVLTTGANTSADGNGSIVLGWTPSTTCAPAPLVFEPSFTG